MALASVSFYDRAARIRAGYSPERLMVLRAVVERPNPEDVFTNLVSEGLRADDRVLDIGTGDGLWLLNNVAPRASVAVGVDNGAVRLREGLGAPLSLEARGFHTVLADARYLPLADSSFTVLTNRRGPFGDTSDGRFFEEGLRVLAKGGRIFEIGIGELNAREISQVFGRSQMLDAEQRGPIIHRLAAARMESGLRVDYAQDMPTFEYFPSGEALLLRLLTAPILPDLDVEGEGHMIDEVARRFSTPRGIRLTFHRTLLISTKVAG